MSNATRKEIGWPAAATLIAAVIGVAAASMAVGFSPSDPTKLKTSQQFASAREIGEVKARLEAIEIASQQMRQELRADIRELRKLILESLRSTHRVNAGVGKFKGN